MRRNSLLTSLAVFITAAPGIAAPFGTVVPLVGHAADIALDESRGQLYIANFTANRIEVMSIFPHSPAERRESSDAPSARSRMNVDVLSFQAFQ